MPSGCPLKIVSFSGIDGAGKSTQISTLKAWLNRSGHRTQLLTFWDDVVVAPGFREFTSHKAFKGDQGVGSPQKPLHRRDKNVISYAVFCLKKKIYFSDVVYDSPSV